jgi:catechol 2,3-dioxygenase-like lactoylglutathione lyase family enzyme
MSAAAESSKGQLNLKFLSHGTLASRDLDFARKFYEEFLGLEVVRTSHRSLMIRLGGANTIAVVLTNKITQQDHLNHNGLDVETKEDVDAAYELILREKEIWKIGHVTKPVKQHGTYAFFFRDADENVWEILTNPKGGYAWLFNLGDQEGKGHQDRSFKRPGVNM